MQRRLLGAAAVIAMVATACLTGVTTAGATAIPPSTSNCSYKVGTKSSTSLITIANNATATPVTVTCTGLPASTQVVVTQGSPLAGGVDPAANAGCEVDVTTAQFPTTTATGTLTASITVTSQTSTPAFTTGANGFCPTGTGGDPNAVCPPTAAQVNAGFASCIVAIAVLSTQKAENFANIAYKTQPKPNKPTVKLTPTSGHVGSSTTASDVTGKCPANLPANSVAHTNACWWGEGVAGASSTATPATITVKFGTTAATSNLTITKSAYCQAGATTAPCTGVPAGDMHEPQLSGTITVPSVANGVQTVTVTETNGSGVKGTVAGTAKFTVN